jgi:hypothetical protein
LVVLVALVVSFVGVAAVLSVVEEAGEEGVVLLSVESLALLFPLWVLFRA